MTEFEAFMKLKHKGFKPPRGPGRCGWCALHKPTQGHREGCPQLKKEN